MESGHLNASSTMKLLQKLAKSTLLTILIGCFLWALGALYYDWAGVIFAGANAAAILAMLAFARNRYLKLAIFVTWFGIILLTWTFLKPSNDREWQPDFAKTAWAKVDGDVVTLHNVRNFNYRTESDYTPSWETRTVRLSQLTGIDVFMNYWGLSWMSHPIISFQFADAPPVCFSIEARKVIGRDYSPVAGLYRQYELIYLIADERDVIRVRTNYREGQDSYLYRLNLPPDKARQRFLEYLTTLNVLHETPRWYNIISTNCTTSIRAQYPSWERAPWDWRILINGKADEMLYERGTLTTEGLPFAELKQRALINVSAKAADDDPDFSKKIRQGLPGM